jgi:hypothetical protein
MAIWGTRDEAFSIANLLTGTSKETDLSEFTLIIGFA